MLDFLVMIASASQRTTPPFKRWPITFLHTTTYLEDGEVLENAVHHVLFRQVLQFVDEIDHVFAHGRFSDAVDEPAVLKPGVFRFHLLHHLLAEGAHLRRTRYHLYVFVALVPNRDNRMREYTHRRVWRGEGEMSVRQKRRQTDRGTGKQT